MGCAASLPVPSDALILKTHYHPRETRILQVEAVDVCKNLNPDVNPNPTLKEAECYKYSVQMQSDWKRGLSAGGSRNDVEMFARNPQFLLVVSSQNPAASYGLQLSGTVDAEGHRYPGRKNDVTVLIYLRQVSTEKLLHIAFFIYKAEEEVGRLAAEYFLCVSPVQQSGVYVNSQVVQRKCSLRPGIYIVVAAAFTPHHSGSFVLSVHSDRPLSLLNLQP